MNIALSLSLLCLFFRTSLGVVDVPRKLDIAHLLGSAQLKISRHRLLNTEQCIADTEALYSNNPALEAALNTYLAQVETQLADPSSSCSASGYTATCTINPSSTSAFPAFRDACMAAGGQLVSTDGSVSCSGTVEGQSITIIMNFVDINDCVADSCSPEDVAVEYDIIFQQLEQDLEAELGWTCTSWSVATKMSLGASVIISAVALIFI